MTWTEYGQTLRQNFSYHRLLCFRLGIRSEAIINRRFSLLDSFHRAVGGVSALTWPGEQQENFKDCIFKKKPQQVKVSEQNTKFF